GGVDTADLTEAGRVGGPQGRRGCPGDGAVAAQVPGAGPVADDDVGRQRFARLGFRGPAPAVARRHAGTVALGAAGLEERLHLLRTVGDQQLHAAVGLPDDGPSGLQAEQPYDPAQVCVAAAAAELAVQRDDVAGDAPLRCCRLDVGHGAHLAGAYDLVLVEEEDGNVGDVDEFVDLRAAGPQGGAGVAVGRGFPNSVCLVADEG